MIKQNKILSIISIFVIYFIGMLLGVFLFLVLPFKPTDNANDYTWLLVRLGVVDLAVTVFIYLFSMIFQNSSVYSPYWSVIPPYLAIIFFFNVGEKNIFSIILLVIILLWALRLTINWGFHFKNLNTEDWRYAAIKTKHPKLYCLISLFGFHLAPTIVTYVGLIPALVFIGYCNLGTQEITLMTFLSYLIAVIAIVIETIADIQMINFKKNLQNQYKLIRTGLWKNSRHPNYFGECLFWFSLFLCSFSFYNGSNLVILIFCPIVIFILFLFVSIPLMDKKNKANKSGFDQYKEETNMLLPIFPPTKK